MISKGQSFCCQSTPCIGVIVAQASCGAPLGEASTEMRQQNPRIKTSSRHPAENGNDRFDDSIMSLISNNGLLEKWRLCCTAIEWTSSTGWYQSDTSHSISEGTQNVNNRVFWCWFVFSIYIRHSILNKSSYLGHILFILTEWACKVRSDLGSIRYNQFYYRGD